MIDTITLIGRCTLMTSQRTPVWSRVDIPKVSTPGKLLKLVSEGSEKDAEMETRGGVTDVPVR